ncbi:MAG TPA: hypothetical protein VFR70_09140 [Flavobacterium sp.]|nr:hypothetical protein [Flavobacterium sp.]
MKKISVLVLFVIAAFSCRDLDGSPDAKADDKKLGKVVGIDKDEKGCVASAGYRWSELKKNCIRPFEVGIRLNPVAEIKAGDPVISAFAVLEEDGGDKVELFMPDEKESIILTRKSQGRPYSNGSWKLLADKGYSLKKGDSLIYAGALINEEIVTGSDKVEN